MRARLGSTWLAVTLVMLGVAGVAPLHAQEATVRVPGNAATPTEREGRRLFVQRCAVCHLPLTPEPRESYGPSLDGVLTRAPEATVRQMILVGSGNMPGWQYTLSDEQVSNIVAYLKTFTTTN
jgi:mono/diheme cytochrome c family protein